MSLACVRTAASRSLPLPTTLYLTSALPPHLQVTLCKHSGVAACSCDIFRILDTSPSSRCVHTEALQRELHFFKSLPCPAAGVIPLGLAHEVKVHPGEGWGQGGWGGMEGWE